MIKTIKLEGEIMNANIIAVSNGPLVLKSDDNSSIIFKDGKKVRSSTPAYLCRCGASKNKPFCDGTHQHTHFFDKRDIKEELIQEYKGEKLTITFNRSICSGAANCVQQLPEVFSVKGSTAWISPDEADLESIIQTIKTCPSGALSYTINDKVNIDSRTTSKISIIKDGPYYVEAIDFKHRAVPTNFAPTKYALCRCGLSKNKPYCDYSHAEKEWSDTNK